MTLSWGHLIGEYDGSVKKTPETWARIIIGVIWVLAPLSIAISGQIIGDMSNDGAVVSWRPPGGTYAVVWGFLIALIMAAWVVVSRNTSGRLWLWIGLVVAFLVVITLANVWLFVYKSSADNAKQKAIAVFISLIMVLMLTLPLAYEAHYAAMALLMPLFGWAVFNLAVSCRESEV
jgi:tryptophan-rich sensory protein